MRESCPARRRVKVSVGDSVRLGVESVTILARALKCHPAVLVFPGWESEEQSAA